MTSEPLHSGNDGIPQHGAPDDDQILGSADRMMDGAPRPEPVLDAAKLAGLVAAVVVAVLGVIALIVAGNVLGDLDALANSISAVIVAFSALAAYLAPVWQARKARAKVTPLADPRDLRGRKLIAVPDPQPRDR
jgi:hypothetical protein